MTKPALKFRAALRVLIVSLLIASAPAALASVVINEIDYDQTDSAEFLRVTNLVKSTLEPVNSRWAKHAADDFCQQSRQYANAAALPNMCHILGRFSCFVP